VIWRETARQAVAVLRKRPAGTGELARACNVDPAFLDDALAPLVDACKLMRINAFRNGAAEFDYRFSATWVPMNGDFDLCIGGGHAPLAAISPVAPATPSKLAPAAPSATAPAHVVRPAMTQEERVEQGRRGAATKHDRHVLERTLAQSPQSLGWAPAPMTAPEPEAEAHPTAELTHQENPMPAKSHKPRPTNGGSPRFQICALLMSQGDLSRDELTAGVSADAKQLYNALYQLKQAGHVVVIEKTGKFHLTATGKDWTSGGANLDNHRAAGSSPREVKRGRRQAREKSAGLPKQEKARLGVVDLRADGSVKKPASTAIALSSQIQVIEERSFRCAVFSDGGFHLAKDGQSIDLTAVEHAQMLRYLERMAEQAA
jgi:hypothetical protein